MLVCTRHERQRLGAAVINVSKQQLCDESLGCLAGLTSMRTLDISQNALTSVDALVEALRVSTRLQRLYAAGNRLSLPLSSLTHFQALSDLDLSGNGLEGTFYVPELKVLTIR